VIERVAALGSPQALAHGWASRCSFLDTLVSGLQQSTIGQRCQAALLGKSKGQS